MDAIIVVKKYSIVTEAEEAPNKIELHRKGRMSEAINGNASQKRTLFFNFLDKK